MCARYHWWKWQSQDSHQVCETPNHDAIIGPYSPFSVSLNSPSRGSRTKFYLSFFSNSLAASSLVPLQVFFLQHSLFSCSLGLSPQPSLCHTLHSLPGLFHPFPWFQLSINYMWWLSDLLVSQISVQLCTGIFSWMFQNYFILFLYIYFLIFRERGRGGEREGKKHQMALTHLQLGTWPTRPACALTGNWTGDLLVHKLTLNPLSHTSQGQNYFKFHIPKTEIITLSPPAPLLKSSSQWTVPPTIHPVTEVRNLEVMGSPLFPHTCHLQIPMKSYWLYLLDISWIYTFVSHSHCFCLVWVLYRLLLIFQIAATLVLLPLHLSLSLVYVMNYTKFLVLQ